MAELVPVEPFDIVVFGATGDLALRKLVPALFHRWCDGQISDDSRIIAASRDPMESAAYREMAATHINGAGGQSDRSGKWAAFVERLTYVAVDGTGEGSGWDELKRPWKPSTRVDWPVERRSRGLWSWRKTSTSNTSRSTTVR